MSGVAKHMDVHKLCNIAVSVSGVLVFEGVSQSCTFLGNDSPFLGSSLALPHCPDEFSAYLSEELSLIDHTAERGFRSVWAAARRRTSAVKSYL